MALLEISNVPARCQGVLFESIGFHAKEHFSAGRQKYWHVCERGLPVLDAVSKSVVEFLFLEQVLATMGLEFAYCLHNTKLPYVSKLGHIERYIYYFNSHNYVKVREIKWTMNFNLRGVHTSWTTCTRNH